jgi:two-component system cell cycle response regulator DivK
MEMAETHMTEGRILYIEDNFDNRILIKRVLEAEGYTVIEAENGQAGLDLAKSSSPDLILMDINLPDIDGYECTIRLRKTQAPIKIPIVALTANVLEGDRQKAIDAGCDGYIAKPIDVDELPNQIATHLKNHH